MSAGHEMLAESTPWKSRHVFVQHMPQIVGTPLFHQLRRLQRPGRGDFIEHPALIVWPEIPLFLPQLIRPDFLK